MRFVKVDMGTGAIVGQPQGHPAFVTLPDGAIVGSAHWTVDELAALGWVNVVGEADPAREIETGYALDIVGEDGDERVVARPIFAPRPLDEIKAEKLANLAAVRYARETGGMGPLRTDRDSQALLTGAAVAAMLDPGYSVAWKTDAGWQTLSAAQIIAAAQAVRAHVQGCFDVERAKSEAIAALATADAVLAYDLETGWPG